MKEAVITLAAVALIGVVGGAVYMIIKKEEDPKVPAQSRTTTAASRNEGAYECYDFMNQCTAGDVGGCKQYEDTCRSAQAVRSSGINTVRGAQECATFRENCGRGDYTSCNLYMRGCEQEQ